MAKSRQVFEFIQFAAVGKTSPDGYKIELIQRT
jgi:hypothetical protein